MKRGFFFASFLLLIFSPSLAEAGYIGFNYEHNYADPRVCGPCTPVGQLDFALLIPETVSPSSPVTVHVNGVAVEALAQVPICPTIRYGNNGVSSMPGAYSSLGCHSKNSFIDTTFSFTAPATPGTYQFCAHAGMNDTVYLVQQGVECVEYTVGGALQGNINVSANIPGAAYTITGPATLNGSGASNSHTAQPTGTYTITWAPVSGYTTPSSDSRTLTNGGTLTFSGTYQAIAPTIDIHF